MSRPNALIFYATSHGHTAHIAARIAEAFAANGVDATLTEAKGHADPDPTDFDAVVIAGSVHAGSHQHTIVDYAKRHHTTLSMRPSAFVSVSLTAADDDPESVATTRQMIDEFVEETGWTPTRTEAVAGALQYLEYDFMTRLAMRLVVRKRGDEARDTSCDHVYTDWDALQAFAAGFAATVVAQRSPAGA